MLGRARRRAKAHGLIFDLRLQDVSPFPARCPILDIPLDRRDRDHSPSLDRIDNKRGYVRGNVIVISYRANTMKNNGTLAELVRLGRWAEKIILSNNE